MRNTYALFAYDTHNVVNEFTVQPSSSRDVDIDLYDVEAMKVLIEMAFSNGNAGTLTNLASTMSVEMFMGWGDADPAATGFQFPCVLDGSVIPTYDDIAYPITLASSQNNSSDPDTLRSGFSFNDLIKRNARWGKLRFTNSDGANVTTVKLYGDA